MRYMYILPTLRQSARSLRGMQNAHGILAFSSVTTPCQRLSWTDSKHFAKTTSPWHVLSALWKTVILLD